MPATRAILYLCCVGDDDELNREVRRAARVLRARQRLARVKVLPPMALPEPDSDAGMFVPAEACSLHMERVARERDGVTLQPGDSLVGFTSARLAQTADSAPGEEYFSFYRSPFASLDLDERLCLVSTALWRQRYQALAFRNERQYMIWSLVAYWLDRFVDPVLTHREYRECIGDYVEDLDSIVYSVRKARLCSACRKHVDDLRVTMPDLAAADNLLRYVRRPPPDRILESIQQSPVLSFMLLGVLFSLFTGAIGKAIDGSVLASGVSAALFILIFGLVFVKEHYFPSRRLS